MNISLETSAITVGKSEVVIVEEGDCSTTDNKVSVRWEQQEQQR